MSNLIAFIGNVSTPNMIIILVIVVLVFGVGKLPEIGRQMGEGLRSFKKAMNDNEVEGEEGENNSLRVEDRTDDQQSAPREVSEKNDTKV